MRDIDHADALAAQAPQRVEQPRHLVGRQARGRFVEYENLGVRHQRAGDGDQRFLGAGEILNPQVGIDVGAELGERARGAFARPTPFD